MPDIDAIPQIKPQTPAAPDTATSSFKVGGESILVPKAIPETGAAPQASSQPTHSSGKAGKIALGGLVVILVLLLLTAIPLFGVYTSAQAFGKNAQSLMAVINSQNIPAIKTEIGKTKSSLRNLNNSYKLISWMRLIPLFGNYVEDGQHAINAGSYGLDASDMAISAGEPYFSILGFGKNDKMADGTKTTQERIDFVMTAIPGLLPKINDISGKVKLASAELNNIDPNRYPATFKGKPVRETMRKYLDLFDEVALFVENGKPLLEVSPYLLGLDSPRNYLVLFQNDKELRPTGGFMTAYSIMKVSKGKFEPVLSNDIYNLDAAYKPSIPAPDPIVKYLKGPYILSQNLRLRDMNWSPDFAESMKLFMAESGKVGIKDVDGIIAVDTQLLVNLLNAIGPIGVPGFGNFSTVVDPQCNCPQVIHELESFADVEGPIVWDPNTGKIVYRPPNSDNRKKIIGPLMNSILANALGQPKEKLPALFEAGFTSLVEKHVLFYLNDAKAQAGAEAFNIAGRVTPFSGDYLYINDANLGGRKSNLYVTSEVEQSVKVVKDGIEKTLTITYKNPEKQDGWLNSVLPDWLRVYVPKGSRLISSEGLDDKAEPYEDLGKTVFAGYYKLRPEGVSRITFKYIVPLKPKGTYDLLIQKQPGLEAPLYTVKGIGKSQEFYLRKDKELKIRL